jgi:hypothetical protein
MKLLLRRTLVLFDHCSSLRGFTQSIVCGKAAAICKPVIVIQQIASQRYLIHKSLTSLLAMTINKQNVQVSDTTGDAIKTKARYQKIKFINSSQLIAKSSKLIK